MLPPAVVRAAFHPSRLAILTCCEGRTRAPREIAEELQVTRSAIRHHVGVLVAAGLLHECSAGYRSSGGWADVLATLEDIATRCGYPPS
jgi:predicted transcriptional regulator